MPEGRGDHPRTLLEWRMADVGEYDTVRYAPKLCALQRAEWLYRHLWVPYEKAFLERGYELFVDGPGFLHCMYGPRDEAQRRAPDGYHQLIDPTQPERRVRYENNVRRYRAYVADNPADVIKVQQMLSCYQTLGWCPCHDPHYTIGSP